MRLDRLLTLYLFGPLARLRRNSGGLRIPILMYHSISDEPETGHPYYWINTSPARFAEHMKFLHDNGYQVISLNQAVEILNSQLATRNSQQKFVVLTFDDGYQDFYSQAFPVLRKYGFTATVFLPTAFIDRADSGLRGKPHLSWDQVRDLAVQGITFGSHTINHPKLYGMQLNEIKHEISESKKIIRTQINRLIDQPGNPSSTRSTIHLKKDNKRLYNSNSKSNISPVTIDSFSFPYRFPEEDKVFTNEMVINLREAGFRNGVTTRVGTMTKESRLFLLERLPVNSKDDLILLGAKLEGAYDWVHIPQYQYKALRRMVGARV
jgi:peptidoglycan/xylan/chitin deacetylase (PgdA/CDA1 family)